MFVTQQRALCVFILLACLLVCTNAFRPHAQHRRTSNAALSSSVDSRPTSTQNTPPQTLTQKEYLIAIRNRLFAVEEQIWLHEYAEARPDTTKVASFSQAKYDALLRARGDLLDEYPVTRLYTDLREAQQRNMTYAAMYLERLIAGFNRQMPVPMEHINEIAVLSHSGQVANLMRGQGAVYHRLLPSSVLPEKGIKRQFQQPAFSNNGRFLAMAEMQFKDNGVAVRADALVFEVPRDAKTFGSSDSMPLFNSGKLPGAPFFLRFSPDDETLAFLCAAGPAEKPPTPAAGVDGAAVGAGVASDGAVDQCTSLVLLDWSKFHRKDAGVPKLNEAAMQRLTPRTALTVMRGAPLFFSYTTSNPKNATIIAHCQQEVADDKTKSMVTEKAVWMLQKTDSSGVMDYKWKKLADSDPAQKWSTPICHSAGGGDSVLIVENGWLVSKSLSRWKRGEDGLPRTKRLLEIKGQAQFLVSPDASRAVVLQEDINMGLYSLTVIEGEAALDPCSSEMGTMYELPCPKLSVAFWFSPDSTKVLLLTSAAKSKEDVAAQKGNFRVALNSDMQWSVFNFPLQELREYEPFKATPYIMKTHVPFFTQYAQTFNPWAPDSRSFVYVTPAGLSHTPLVDSKHCLGEDRWQNQGASFGTWSRF